MINIFFHGASVTQQDGDSSYFRQLEYLVKDDLEISISKKGYGGCHLSDAGFLTISSDVGSDIDICFMDWSTTGQSDFDQSKLRYMVGVLLDRKITPVFLLFARRDNDLTNRVCDKQVMDLCREFGVSYLDLRSELDFDLHLRDVVHTNEKGAKIYAKFIYEKIKDMLSSEYALAPISYEKYVVSCDENSVFDVCENDEVFVDLHGFSDASELIFKVVHGPSSGFLSVDDLSRICIWDQWSHYDRLGFVSIKKFVDFDSSLPIRVSIKVLSDEVDYSKCARDFEYSGMKYLKIRGVYGVNCIVSQISTASKQI